ncbi:MAG TPA: aldolase/citrate lyase family protein [Ramlibacter sp.]|jgi:hypothetical protein|nr:aldolase/citrate lyase family protein [Ramlibacter sp.]
MLELIQITNDPAFAQRCDALGGFRVFVDLERMGKAERQAGLNTFISEHDLEDVARIRAVLRRSPLMVRVNPLHEGTPAEVDAVLARGADSIMLPMFSGARELRAFCGIVAGRVPVVALLETADALASLDSWAGTPELGEIYVGLNDLHLSLGCRFMFEPLADGSVERVARVARSHGLAFGFGGIARLDEGLLPGRDVLAEHLRLGSGAVILSRTFHREVVMDFEHEIARLRALESELAARSPRQVEEDAARIALRIREIAQASPSPR